MVWPMIAMAAVSAASSMMGQRNAGKIEAARTESENRIAAAKAEAENRMRPAQNALVAAQASLQRWAQSVNNNAMLDAAAAQHEANAVNSLRAEDAALEMDFDAGIAAAEEAGAQSAAAATMGLMGGVVDTINMTSALRRNRGKQSAMDAKDMREFDQRTRASGIMEQTWRGLDGSAIFENMDYGESIATRSLSGPDRKYTGVLAGVSAFAGAGGFGALGSAFKDAPTQAPAPISASKASWTAPSTSWQTPSYSFNVPKSTGFKL